MDHMQYTDKAAVQNYSLTNIAGTFDTQLTAWITAMSRHMDTYCGRTLVEDAPETRKFDGSGRDTLVIDEVHAITAVTVDGTTVTPVQYPANGSRKYRLVLPRQYWTPGLQNVEVTGIFARYATTVPEDIKFACTVLVAGIVNAANRQDEAIESERIGQYAVTYRTPAERADFKRAKEIMDLHRRIAF